MSIGTIYKITNTVNGKVYIGQTSKAPSLRFKQHKDILRKCLSGKTSWDHLRKAMKKYGVANFQFDVIFQTFALETLSEFEVLFIEEYDSFNAGYNKTKGGEGACGYKHNEEIRAGMARRMKGEGNPMYGVPTSDEHKKRLSKVHKGKTLSDEHRKTLSEIMSSERNPSCCRVRSEEELLKASILRGTPITLFGETYRSLHVAADALGVSRGYLKKIKERELLGWTKEECLKRIYNKRPPCSEDRKAKISAANGIPVTYLGITYPSKNALAKALGLSKIMLATRIKNKTIVLE